jgi:hypothetical protein
MKKRIRGNDKKLLLKKETMVMLSERIKKV